MTQKRRHYDRVSMSLPFCMHLQNKTFSGKTYNISMNGVYVSLDEGDVKDIGSGVSGKCQFSLKDIHITLDCMILRVFKQEVAIQFTDLSAEKFNLLRALLAYGAYAKDILVAHRKENTIAEDRYTSNNYDMQATLAN